jgi:hypothetical protein
MSSLYTINCTQVAKWLVAYDRISIGEWTYWNFQKSVKTNITCEVAQRYGTFFNNKKHINYCFKLCYKMCTLQCCKCNYNTICKQHQRNKNKYISVKCQSNLKNLQNVPYVIYQSPSYMSTILSTHPLHTIIIILDISMHIQ